MNDEITNVAGDSKAPALGRTGALPEAIISHYDKGEDFFKLVLGPELIYSCALFEGDDDLVEAQRRKLDYHIEAANAANAKRVLDVGCGWGAMLRRLVDHAEVPHVVGLTLSPSQANWIRRQPRPGLEVVEQDWRDHKPTRRYDAIISVVRSSTSSKRASILRRSWMPIVSFLAFAIGCW